MKEAHLYHHITFIIIINSNNSRVSPFDDFTEPQLKAASNLPCGMGKMDGRDCWRYFRGLQEDYIRSDMKVEKAG